MSTQGGVAVSDEVEASVNQTKEEVEDLDDLDYVEELMEHPFTSDGWRVKIPKYHDPQRIEMGYYGDTAINETDPEFSSFETLWELVPEEGPLSDVWTKSDLRRVHGLEEKDIRKADKVRLQRLKTRSTLKKHGLQCGATFWHRKRRVWCRIEDIDYDNRRILLTRLGKKGWVGPFSNTMEYVLKDPDLPLLIPGKCPQV